MLTGTGTSFFAVEGFDTSGECLDCVLCCARVGGTALIACLGARLGEEPVATTRAPVVLGSTCTGVRPTVDEVDADVILRSPGEFKSGSDMQATAVLKLGENGRGSLSRKGILGICGEAHALDCNGSTTCASTYVRSKAPPTLTLSLGASRLPLEAVGAI